MSSTLAPDALRPTDLSRFIGQTNLKKVLNIAIAGANAREEALGHTLFVGPPGLGKTTLARLISSATHRNLVTASGPSITKCGTLATLLNALNNESGVLFIDEVHRLPRVVEEALYTVMEDYRLDVTTDKMHFNISLPKFTLVGATTRFGMITKPMRDRFMGTYHLDFYSQEELCSIIVQSAGVAQIEIEPTAVEAIAQRSKKTPRIANNLLLQTRDFALSYGINHVSYPVVLGMMDMLEIDERGLGKVDRLILRTIIEKFQGGPVGIDTLSGAMIEEPDVLENVYEPFLVQEGLLLRTKSGRVASQAAWELLGITKPRPGGYAAPRKNEVI